MSAKLTEWEKVQKGMVYDDYSQDLVNRRTEIKKYTVAYNKLTYDDGELREYLMKKMFKHVGKNVCLEPSFKCEFGKNISIGDGTFINFDCIFLDCAEINIGKEVFIGPRLGLYAVNHAYLPEQRLDGATYSQPINIGDRCWIGGDVTVVGGVTIGEGSIIGAGSVVVNDIPAGVIAAGNPCKVIREITEDDRIEGYTHAEDRFEAMGVTG